jgi:hypothetical protein
MKKIWEDKKWENLWWPKRLRDRPVQQRELATA